MQAPPPPTPPLPPLRGSSMAGRKSVSVVREAPAGGATRKVFSGRDKCECDTGLHGVYHSLSCIHLLLVFLLVGCFEFLRNCGTVTSLAMPSTMTASSAPSVQTTHLGPAARLRAFCEGAKVLK